MKKNLLLILIPAITLLSFTSDKPAYLLYDKDGREVKYSKMLKDLEDADMIFFGELHTDPIAHWMQIELTKALYSQKKEALVLGAEMFEADNQVILHEYLGGLYPADKFEAEMRLWNNYHTDYKPLVEFAKVHQIPFIATNIPRRYASMVYKGGFEALEALSDEAKRFIAPLPILYDPEVKCYKDMLDMGTEKAPEGLKEIPEDMKAAPEGMMTDTAAMEAPAGMKTDTAAMEAPVGMKTDTTAMEAPVGMNTDTAAMKAPMGMPAAHGMSMEGMENLPKAQAAKDATMAHFILENWSAGKTFFHLNGSYHSNNHQGIIWYIQQQNRELRIVTINTVLQEEIGTLSEEYLNSADYIICVPESMTRTGR
ncbi:MAG: ChaN family lipoprotein [Bacteroidales bacterium]